MSSEARTLLGELLVASVELEAGGDPERWLVLATETTAALRSVPDDAWPLLAELIGTLTASGLLARERRAFEDVWPRISWEKACVMRTGFEALRDLFEQHAPALVAQVEMSRVEQLMIQHSERFQPPPVPDGATALHWWWFGGLPGGERTVVMNQRMRDLMPPIGYHANDAPPKFRALVAAGFVAAGELVFFRHCVPDPIPILGKHAHATYVEADRNAVSLGDVFEPDPSRRPVDTAASAIACARHLAYELRRTRQRCRIIVNVHTSLNTIRFHRVRQDQDWATKDGAQVDLDHYTSAMLVLDSQ